MRSVIVYCLAALLVAVMFVGSARLGIALREDDRPATADEPCLPIPTGGSPRVPEAA